MEKWKKTNLFIMSALVVSLTFAGCSPAPDSIGGVVDSVSGTLGGIGSIISSLGTADLPDSASSSQEIGTFPIAAPGFSNVSPVDAQENAGVLANPGEDPDGETTVNSSVQPQPVPSPAPSVVDQQKTLAGLIGALRLVIGNFAFDERIVGKAQSLETAAASEMRDPHPEVVKRLEAMITDFVNDPVKEGSDQPRLKAAALNATELYMKLAKYPETQGLQGACGANWKILRDTGDFVAWDQFVAAANRALENVEKSKAAE